MESYALKKSEESPAIHFDWGRLYWYASGPEGNSDAQTFGKCVLLPGQGNPRHLHPNCEEILHVAKGSIDHFVDGVGWIPMKEGDTITIAANIWHCARNTGDGEAELFISFSSEERETIGEV